jgi:hypothetical protein
MSAAAAALTGTIHAIMWTRHHGAATGAGVVRTIAASIAWHRAHSAAWFSTAVRSRAESVCSAHAARVSAPRHRLVSEVSDTSDTSDTFDTSDTPARSASRISCSSDDSRSCCSFFTYTSSC